MQPQQTPNPEDTHLGNPLKIKDTVNNIINNNFGAIDPQRLEILIETISRRIPEVNNTQTMKDLRQLAINLELIKKDTKHEEKFKDFFGEEFGRAIEDLLVRNKII